MKNMSGVNDSTRMGLNIRKPITIRQTKTSELRFKKANPLPDLLKQYSHVLANVDRANQTNSDDVSVSRRPIAATTRNFVKENAQAASKYKQQRGKNGTTCPKAKLVQNTTVSNTRDNKPHPGAAPLRKSLTFAHLHRKKHIKVVARSPSLLTLRQVEENDPLPVVRQGKTVTFRTPVAYDRRSVAFSTPNTNPASRKSCTPFKSTPSGADLQRRLNNWLMKHGKPLSSYHNLKNFESLTNDEDKENVAVEQSDKSTSYENLCIETQATLEPCNPNCNVILGEVLDDLHKLILDGYSRDHCEMWLRMIKEKYEDVEKNSLYWECRAALEEARGNIGSALDFYKSAIIQGAEVANIDESLDNLLQKFSLLNLSASKYSPRSSDVHVKNRERIVLEARNAFKSSIIKFAIQEKSLKKIRNVQPFVNESSGKKTFVATPVRRSTRESRTSYVCTPGVKICSTLKEIDMSDNEDIVFRCNRALN